MPSTTPFDLLSRCAYIRGLDAPDKERVGNKFHGLSRIADVVRVPEAACLESSAFARSLPEPAQEAIRGLLRLLRSNGGYQLNRLQREIQRELDRIEIPAEIRAELEQVAALLSRGWKHRLIARSSTSFEDLTTSSGAGIYESIGDLSSFERLLEAVVKCWSSAFSLPALAHRLRIGAFDLEPLPGLILQRYVRSTCSGVAFSRQPHGVTRGIYVEYTDAGTDGVESGRVAPKSFLAFQKDPSLGGFVISDNDLPAGRAKELVETTLSLQERLGGQIEYEWAYDGESLCVLQARPITALDGSPGAERREPLCKVFDLYRDAAAIPRDELGDVRAIFDHSIRKRKPIRDYAEKEGIAIYGASVVIVDRRGLSGHDLGAQGPLCRLKTPLLTIDVGPYLRSFYSKRAALGDTLQALISGAPGGVPLIIREFASGRHSAVSAVGPEGCVIVEVCRGSLIGINRGFVDTQTVLVDVDRGHVQQLSAGSAGDRYYDFDDENCCFKLFEGNPGAETEPVPEAALLEIAGFTRKVQAEFGRNMLEWTILDRRPVFVDNTPESVTAEGASTDGLGVRFLSPGRICGTALCMSDLAKLEYISSGPTLNVAGHLPTLESNAEIAGLIEAVEAAPDTVVVSKFPYTALSVVVDKVKGFIFEAGPMLCHLAIIAREAKVPVAIVPGALSMYRDGQAVDL
ncbi:PEP/pyruvate-binding domain-containing protein [Sorangium sp. So ce131]|uniref:PEP/pyruvate-binding domain-containing protein n=1 Tax=Sorangium sp. So ce131 TaxID=3133282 RepID=UPI003F5DCA50